MKHSRICIFKPLILGIVAATHWSINCTAQLMSGGYDHSIAMCSGNVWAWGRNLYGEIGDNTTVQRNTPVHVLAGAAGGTYLTGITAVSAGYYYSLALRNDGTVWAWGHQVYGQLGDNSTVNRKIPVQVLAGAAGGTYLTGIMAIAAGYDHTLALRNDGTVWAWGSDGYGQLGVNYAVGGTTGSIGTPVQVLAGASGGTYLTGIIAIAAGGTSSFALRNDGTVWAWGDNLAGQLGDNTTTKKNTPIQVLAGAAGGAYLTGITAIDASDDQYYVHVLALRNDGTVWSWGYNNTGELGDGTGGFGTNKYTPVQVLAGDAGGTYLSGITSIAAGGGASNGYGHSLALRNDNTVWAWGSAENGQLGETTVGVGLMKTTPVQVYAPGGAGCCLTGISAIAAGSAHSFAVKPVGTLYDWGYNGGGRLGTNNTTTYPYPVLPVGLCSVIMLPVELIYFNANCADHAVRLQWQTASEENNDYFTIERSADGINFEPVGTVKGEGNSSTLRNYEFTDVSPLSFGEGLGERYYRLRQTDFNGQYEYYGPVSVNLAGCEPNTATVFPVISSNGCFTITGKEKGDIAVYDLCGKKIYETFTQSPGSSVILNLSSQPSGVYFLNIKTEQGVLSKKIILHK